MVSGMRLISVLLLIFVFDHAFCRPNGDSDNTDSADSMGDRGNFILNQPNNDEYEATTSEYEDHLREFKATNEDENDGQTSSGENVEENDNNDDDEYEENESGSNKFVEKIGSIFDKIGDFFFGGSGGGNDSEWINNTLRFEEDADCDPKFDNPPNGTFEHNKTKDGIRKVDDDDDHVGIFPRKMHVYKHIGEKQEIDCFPHRATLSGPHINTSSYDASVHDNYGRYYLNTKGKANLVKLDISNLQKNDSGQYNCSLDGYHRSFNLHVLDDIVFDTNITTQTVHNDSEDFHMSCHATGNQMMMLNITWEVDQSPIYKHDPNGISTMEYKRFDIDDHNQLIIKKPITQADAHRVYKCIATESIEHRAEHDGHVESEEYSFSNSTQITLVISTAH